MNERYDFHPLVALWLKARNYIYRHEVKMPERGIADYVAEHPDGHTLIIECKVDAAVYSEKSLVQLMNYQRQLPDSLPAYAVPADLVTETVIERCKAQDILLIPIEIPEELKQQIREIELRRAQYPKAERNRTAPEKWHVSKEDPSYYALGRVVLEAYRQYIRRSQQKMAARGYDKFAEPHFHALRFLDSGGTRIVTLAERAKMTKQSMGDLIHELENQGYVQLAKDKKDKRASIVRFTERGQQFLVDAYEVKREMEAEYRALVGEADLEQFFAVAWKILDQATDDPIT